MLYVQCLATLIEEVKNVFDVNRTGNMKPQELMIGGEPVSLETHLLLLWIKQAQAPQHYPQTRVQLRASLYYVQCVAALIWTGEECIRCEQDREYETSRIAHGGSPCSTGDPIPLTLEEMRSRRIALLSNPGMTEREPGNGELSDNLIISPGPRNEQSTHHDQDFVEQGTSSLLDLRPERLCTVHRSCIKTDLIEHFKDPSVMNYNIDFKIINEWGELELRVGTGVIPEVYTLFWNEFSIPMTIGERERVPFVRYDHFVEEWEFVGRILVKRFESVSYFPTFLSKSFICYCLFGNQVPDSIFIDSFSKYLSPLEEELILDVMRKNEILDNKDELNDFLERYQCRKVVNDEKY